MNIHLIQKSGKSSNKTLLKIIIFILLFIPSMSVFASHITIDTLHTYSWNARAKNWKAFERKIVVYNDLYKLSEITQMLCNKNWMNYSMRSYTYDQNNVLMEMNEKFWSDMLQSWPDNFREIYAYNENGQVDSIFQYNIYGKNISEEAIIHFTYTDEGLLSSKIYQQFADQWTNEILYEYEYDSSKITCESVSYWNDDNWEKPLYKTTYQYDADGKLVKLIKRQRINMDDYQSIFNKSFEYSNDGLILSLSEYRWDNIFGNWEEISKVEYSLDKNGDIITGLTRLSDQGNWFNYMANEIYTKNEIDRAAVALNDISFWVVPSRFKKSITIEFDNPESMVYRVKILNSKGEVLVHTEMPDNRIILDTKEMDKGEYFLEVTGNGHFAGKFNID